jgi:DNA-binding NtrC family response regulator
MSTGASIKTVASPTVPLKILTIDDDPQNINLVTAVLQTENVEILSTTDPIAGLELFRRTRPQVVLLDLIMPNVKGMELLEQIVEMDPAAEVILMTGHYSTESAVEAIQKGACDYITKPLDVERLRSRVNGILADAKRRHRTLHLERELLETCEFQGIVGRGPLMLEVFAKIRRAAPHFRTVLVTGATGTGKELVARAFHELSPVASSPFAICNCSALVETLIESELFGYVRGAFTGATQDKVGIFEYANGGTVFLDEIGELPLPSQAKLLRVLQNHEIQRVGSPSPRKVDVHVVAATNHDLRSRVQEGRFREDLFYRLAMVELALPRLSERREDLTLLQRHFLRKFAAQYKKEITGITRRAQTVLARYPWPGNVRELENVIGNACMMVAGSLIDVQDLPESVRNQDVVMSAEGERLLPMEEVQRRHLLRVLEHTGGNKSRTAEILGLSRATVYEMLSKMKMDETEPAKS